MVVEAACALRNVRVSACVRACMYRCARVCVSVCSSLPPVLPPAPPLLSPSLPQRQTPNPLWSGRLFVYVLALFICID
jgi:hypothetical protein